MFSMKRFTCLSAAVLLAVPVLAGAMPLLDLQILGDLCTITDDAHPQINRPVGKGNPDGGPIDFGPLKTITDDAHPQINRPPGRGNPDGGPIDFGPVKAITDDINPQINRPPGRGNPAGGPVDLEPK